MDEPARSARRSLAVRCDMCQPRQLRSGRDRHQLWRHHCHSFGAANRQHHQPHRRYGRRPLRRLPGGQWRPGTVLVGGRRGDHAARHAPGGQRQPERHAHDLGSVPGHLQRHGLEPLVGPGEPRHRHRTHQRAWILGSRQRRRDLQLRRCPVLRLHGKPPSERADRRHGGDTGRCRLLATGIGRRHLCLRRRRLLRLHRRHAPQCTDRRHFAHSRRRRLLARGVRRWDLRVRRRAILRIHRRPAPRQADRRHGLDLRRRRLLARGVRRRDLRVRRRRNSSDPPEDCRCRSRSSA